LHFRLRQASAGDTRFHACKIDQPAPLPGGKEPAREIDMITRAMSQEPGPCSHSLR
jgi:hypothetical protein